jgi:hypothetical protein
LHDGIGELAPTPALRPLKLRRDLVRRLAPDTKVQSLLVISSDVIAARYQLLGTPSRAMVLELSTALLKLIKVCAIGKRKIKCPKQAAA